MKIPSIRTLSTTGNLFLRFFAASLFGLAFDIALASVFHHVLGLSLLGSAAISLVCAAALMYFVHEFWTFNSGIESLSGWRLSATVVSALVALALRSISLLLTSQGLGLGDRFAIAQFVFATAISFVLNFLLVRRIMASRS